ncbi:MAG: hypothetical protein KIG91_02805, partial [Treponema sp.]|nr:hypothetical protein [Treponema sp.]
MTLEVENAFGAAKSGGLFRDMNMVYNFKKMKNRNEYGKIYRNPLFKRLAILLVLLFCVESVWGDTFRWKENVATGNWNNSANWEINTSGSNYKDTNNIPGTGDVVFIGASSDVSITIPAGYDAVCNVLCTNSNDSSTGNVIINVEGTLKLDGAADIEGAGENSGITNVKDSPGLVSNYGAGSSGYTKIIVKNDCSFSNVYVNSRGRNSPGTATGYTEFEVALGKTLTIDGRIEMSARAESNTDSTLNIKGSGEVSCFVYDPAIREAHTQTVDISDNATFNIRHHYFGDADATGISKFTGSGTLKIPASGAYMNYGTTCGFSYASTLKILPNNEDGYYSVAVSGLNTFPGTVGVAPAADILSPITITLTCEDLGGGTQIVYFPFKIKTLKKTGSEVFKIDSTYSAVGGTKSEYTIASMGSGFLGIQANGTSSVTKEIKINSDTVRLPNADGFSIEVWTPDNARVLSTIEWFYKTPTWVGTKSSVWSDTDNWAGLEADHSVEQTFNKDYPNYELTIKASATRMPVVNEGAYNLKSLTINPNASIEFAGGTLTVESFIMATEGTMAKATQTGGELKVKYFVINGNSKFTATTGGTVTFTEDQDYSPAIPENIQFYNIKAPEKVIGGTKNIFIAGDLTGSDFGAWRNTGILTFNGTGDQTFTPKADTKYHAIQENKTGGKLIIESALKADSFTIAKGTDTSFNGEVKLSSFTDAPNAGKISFKAGGTILSNTVFETTGDVTFDGSDTLSFETNNVVHSDGKTYIKAGISAASATFDSVEVTGTPKITADLSITGTVTAESSATLQVAGNLTDTTSLWSDEVEIKFVDKSSTFTPDSKTYTSISIDASGETVTVAEALTATNFTVSNGTVVLSKQATVTNFANNGTVVLSKQATVTNFANNGSVEITGGDTVIPVSGAFSGTGTIKLLNGKVKLTSTGPSLQSEIILEKADVTIAGNFSVTDFTATTNMNGKSVTLDNSKITVSGTLALEGGSSADDELYVSGFSGDGFIVTENKTGGNYLKIDPNIAIFNNSDSVGVFTYSGSNSIPAQGITDEHYAAVIRNGWNIKDKKLLTYRWKTDATDSEWTKASNWDLEIVPVNDATVIIQAPVNAETKSSPVVSSAVSVGNLAIESRAKITLSDSANLTLSGKAGNGDAAEKISNEGTIVYKSSGRITDGSNAINDFDSGTVEYSTGSGSVTEMGTSDYFNLVISSGTWSCENTVTAKNLSISGGTISGTFSAENGINITGTVLASGNVTFSNNVTNTGTLTAGTGPLTFSGDYDGASGTLNGKDGASSGDSITFEGNVTFGNFKHNDEKVSFSISDDKSLITNNQLFASADFNSTVTGKKISVTGLLRVQENISNNNVLDENVNLEISGSQTTEITGIKKVNKLTINNTSTSQTKTIKFPSGSGNKITVSDEFYVTGKNLSDDGKNLILTTSVSGDADNESTWWYIDAKVDKSSVENAEIRYAFSENDISSKLTSCVEGPDGDYTTYNWFSEHKYYWFGNENSSWSNKGNWSTSSDSFNPASKAPRITDSSSVIEIIKDGTEAGTNLLVLAEDVTVKSFTVNESQKVQLAGKSVTGNEIENNGIIIIDGTKGIPLNAANIFHNSSSTIEFSGWTSGNVVQTTYDGLGLPEVQESKGFKNLIVSGNGKDFVFTSGSDLVVLGTFFTDVSKISTGSKKQTYSGKVTLGSDTTFSAYEITFGNELNSDTAETHDVTIIGNATFKGAVGTTSFNSLAVTGTSAVNGGSITTKETQTYTDAITLGNAAIFTGSTITFSNEVTGGKDLTISGDVSFGNNVTASKVSVSGTTDVGGNVTTTGGTQSYTGAVTVKVDTTFTGSDITFENELNSDTAETHDVTIIGNAIFTGAVGITSFNSLSVSGTSALNGGSVITKGTQIYTGVVTLGNAATFTGSTITFSNEVTGGKDLILDAALTEFYDKVSAENFVLYGGTVNLNADLSTIRDVVLLGKNYSTHDEHLYTKRRRKNHNFMAALKSASLISRDGIINIDDGHEINVGENFYANTVTLKGKQEWYLRAKNNSDSDVCFIEAYNSIIKNSRVKGTVPSKVTKGMAEGCTDNGENTDWDFDDFVIVEANTVTDSVIRIKFNKPVRNLHEEFSSLVSKIHYDSGTKNFANIYKDYSFNSGAWNVSAIGTSEPDVVYIETLQSRWNTDANGTFTGDTASTDSYGVHQETLPNLKFD